MRQKVDHVVRYVPLQGSPQGYHIEHSVDELLECSRHPREKSRLFCTLSALRHLLTP